MTSCDSRNAGLCVLFREPERFRFRVRFTISESRVSHERALHGCSDAATLVGRLGEEDREALGWATMQRRV